MGKMTFQLPGGLPAEAARELERACLSGGPDNMPQPTRVALAGGALSLARDEDESGYLVAPWALACRVGPSVPAAEPGDGLLQACNGLTLPLSWGTVERGEGEFHWGEWDVVVDWAERQGMELAAGPLIDFSAAMLPHWLWGWE